MLVDVDALHLGEVGDERRNRHATTISQIVKAARTFPLIVATLTKERLN
ncbi:MAG: hypothetical protein H0V24_15555 [Chloroflexia bacterium]|nr:hypothetical protein [Chloroflexia bacterium]